MAAVKIWQVALLVTLCLFLISLLLRNFMVGIRKNSTDVVSAIHSELFTMMHHNETLAKQLHKLQGTVKLLNHELQNLSSENKLLRQEVSNLTIEISILSDKRK